MGLSLGQSFNHSLAQKQGQYALARQVQSMKVLQMTSQELAEFLKQEMSRNPALEVTSDREILIGDPLQEDPSADGDWEPQNNGDSWTQEDEERRNHFLESQSSGQSLQEQLQEQIREKVADESSDLYRACQFVLGNLNPDGLLESTEEEIAEQAKVSEEVAEEAIAVIQSLTPAGIGGRDLQEVLLLQLDRKGLKDSLAWKICSRYFDALGHNRMEQIADDLEVELDDVLDARDVIATLNPKPGAGLSNEATHTILPDVFVEKNQKGAWVVSTNKCVFPIVTISREYEEMKASGKLKPKDKKYLLEKIAAAAHVQEAVVFRENTIVRIAEKIVQLQLPFFEEGPDALLPMTMAKVADLLKVSVPTVSRAVNSKYMKTPHGVLCFRKFFTAGYVSQKTGEEFSNAVVRGRIKEVIDGENRNQPYSDQAICAILGDQGIQVARRTVAKYREQLNIPKKSMRRNYRSDSKILHPPKKDE